MSKSKTKKTFEQLLKVVGRETELSNIEICLKNSKNVLLEGPVGVGKTHLAAFVTQKLNLPVIRIDGDQRYSEQKLAGWFDPPLVLKKGYTKSAFIKGPLIEAMSKGAVLFINELNRFPEGVQNILLPAIDERMVLIPKIGMIKAHPNFKVIATQNPKEFVATSHLSEALMDRFELVFVDYQDFDNEVKIVQSKMPSQKASPEIAAAVAITRLTRESDKIRRGASLRAAISIAEIALGMNQDIRENLIEASIIALPTRIELDNETGSAGPQGRKDFRNLVEEWVDLALKKKLS